MKLSKLFILTILILSFFVIGCGDEAKTEEKQEIQKVEESKVEEETAEQIAEDKRVAEEKIQAEMAAKKAEEEKRLLQKQAAAERLQSLYDNGVIINYSIEKVGHYRYKVSGTTNLPDGMQIIVELSNQNLIKDKFGMGRGALTEYEVQILRENSYKGQDKPAIRNGYFETIFSGFNDKNFNNGECGFSITSPINRIQSKEIQTILGDRGANLYGQGVVYDEQFGKRISIREFVYLQ